MTVIQEDNILAFKAGHIMTNPSRGRKIVQAFSIGNKMYITKSVKRTTEYSFDDKGWSYTRLPYFRRMLLSFSKKFKEAKPCAKATLAFNQVN